MEGLTAEVGAERVIDIESLEHEGRGVGHWQGKTIFVDGALTGERVEFSPYRRKPAYEFAKAGRLLRESAQRVSPICPHFGMCGGCTLQHLQPRAQVAAKQRILEDALWHIGRVRPEYVLAAIHGPSWGYRKRARLTVRNVIKKGGVLVGFHEKKSSYVADMLVCHVLTEKMSALLPQFRNLVASLSVCERLPQIEVSSGDDIDVIVLRILQPLTVEDESKLRSFADDNELIVYLQSSGPETARLFHPPDAPELTYRLPEFRLELAFGPTEFTQVNAAVNRVLVSRAIGLLAPTAGERIADMFCGLGNFSLAIARMGAEVIGFEGSESLVGRAASNAARNGLSDRSRFVKADLFKQVDQVLVAHGPFDRMLIDPPRDGAIELVTALREPFPTRIVYVSCNPATLARDAEVLVQVHGYRMVAAGVVNMFPHTSHVESLAVFDRG
jgi:23S rRNA (uracil1939-C5)-methyltransferase